jgi:1,4-alpha-glucan branching enzyme
MYFYNENFILPLSHDEVVHGKSPMIYKMPGDDWQKLANLRLLYTYMFTHPGAKLLFMGNEFAQTSEWNYKTELDWFLLQYESHKGMQQCVQELNELYKNEPALYELQFEPGGFEWNDLNHRMESVISYKRKGKQPEDELLIILNMTPVVRYNWEIYVTGKTAWKEIFNSDASRFWGSGNVYNPNIQAVEIDAENSLYKLTVHLPPLGAIVLK